MNTNIFLRVAAREISQNLFKSYKSFFSFFLRLPSQPFSQASAVHVPFFGAKRFFICVVGIMGRMGRMGCSGAAAYGEAGDCYGLNGLNGLNGLQWNCSLWRNWIRIGEWAHRTMG